jgi:hypothetical protein
MFKLHVVITSIDVRSLVAKELGLKDPFTLEIVDYHVFQPAQVIPVVESVQSTGFAGSGEVAELPPTSDKPFLACLDSYDWEEVFGEGTGGNCSIIHPDGPPGSDVSLATFERKDVALVVKQEEGENDGADWIVYGQLKDGRWFIARGGCDYTGWDCRASNSGNVAWTREDLIAFGMSEDERKRFGVPLPGDDKTQPVTSR